MSQTHTSHDHLPELDNPKRARHQAGEERHQDLLPATVEATGAAAQASIAQRTWTHLDSSARARGVLAHQQMHGNASTTQQIQTLDLQRQAAPAQAPGAAPTNDTLPDADDLTARIARCIGIWETNRGKDNPAPKESALDTVAGVHASMATIEQATMPYAIAAIKGHKELRDKADPPLTIKELNAAEARCTAVVTLLKAVSDASAKGTQPDDFIQQNTAAITATGLSNDDVKTMFEAVTLKATIDAARAEIKKKKTDLKKANPEITQAAKDIPEADRVGLGEASLKSYIRTAANWGENRAAWQRKAVAAMPDNVGARIEAVSVSDNGTALAIPVIRSRVDAQLAKKPQPTAQEIVKAVAQQNNPNEQGYGQHVWETYQRLYP